jgi:hypothetical protein
MKWILSLLICWSACAQLPIIPYSIPASGTWYPTNVTSPSALVFWYDTFPTPSLNGARDSANAAGAIPANNANTLSWSNLLNYAAAFGGNYANKSTVGHEPIYHNPGGGYTALQPEIAFTNGNNCDMISQNIPTMLLTNFTIMALVAPSNIVTTIQGLFDFSGNGFNYPFLEWDVNKLSMSANATRITGPAVLLSQPYIVTWVNAGASSVIYTNGVLYVSGTTGVIGANSPASFNIAHIHGKDGGNPGIVGNNNQFVGAMSRVWVWTNVLSAGDLANATAQCKKDFNVP